MYIRLFFILILAWSQASAEQVQVLRYPQVAVDDPVFLRQADYVLEILSLAMSKAGLQHRLEPVDVSGINNNRNARNMSKGLYDVTWLHTNPDREQTLLPIRVPLFKGLAGWRLMLIQPASVEKFRDITEDQLKAFRAGLGNDWPDVQIMRANGYQVETSVGRDSLLNMLRAGRIDYLSRSIMEVWGEIDSGMVDGLMLECCFALQYPSAFYFFVAQTNVDLANTIELGLNRAIADGSFDQIFARYYAEAIEKADLKGRKIISLNNIPISTSDAFKRKELWFQR